MRASDMRATPRTSTSTAIPDPERPLAAAGASTSRGARAVYDRRRPGIVIDVGIFDARSGSMIRIVRAK